MYLAGGFIKLWWVMEYFSFAFQPISSEFPPFWGAEFLPENVAIRVNFDGKSIYCILQQDS
jgi:hypothetical protein